MDNAKNYVEGVDGLLGDDRLMVMRCGSVFCIGVIAQQQILQSSTRST
jgi:hypothetical protein